METTSKDLARHKWKAGRHHKHGRGRGRGAGPAGNNSFPGPGLHSNYDRYEDSEDDDVEPAVDDTAAPEKQSRGADLDRLLSDQQALYAQAYYRYRSYFEADQQEAPTIDILEVDKVMQLDPEALAETLSHLPYEEFFGLPPVYTACLQEDAALKDAAARLHNLLLEEQQQQQQDLQPAPQKTQGEAVELPPYPQHRAARVSDPHPLAPVQPKSRAATEPSPAAAAAAAQQQYVPLVAVSASGRLPSSTLPPTTAAAPGALGGGNAAAAAEDNEDDGDDLLDELLGQCIGKPGTSVAATRSSSDKRGMTIALGTPAPLPGAPLAPTPPQPVSGSHARASSGVSGRGPVAPVANVLHPVATASASAAVAGGGLLGTSSAAAGRAPPPAGAVAAGRDAASSTGADAVSLEDELDALLGLGEKSKAQSGTRAPPANTGSTHRSKKQSLEDWLDNI